MARVPTASEIAGLSRDDWEALCRSVCAIIHQAEGVEDRRGKGNGLDMIRIDPDGALGWQFRRFDDRFGDKQRNGIRDAVQLAAERCLSEDGVRLVCFTLWANIDLEPGHIGQTGERERFARLKESVQKDLNVDLRFKGITWVHAQLLDRPRLRPDLFEDVPAQVAAISAQLKTHDDEMKALINSLADGRGPAAILRLAEQASIHFERGKAHSSAEQFRLAAQCLTDALNLIKGLEVDQVLEGRILCVLAGMQRMLGELPAAESSGRTALVRIPAEMANDVAHAKGNLALVLRDQQKYPESKLLLTDVLDHFESKGDSVEIVRTLTNLAELAMNAHDLAAVAHWGHRLDPAIRDLESVMGRTDVSLVATAALSSGLLAMGIENSDNKTLHAAEVLLANAEITFRENQMRPQIVAALAQRAQAIRFQNRLPEALALYNFAHREADASDLGKMAADSFYNEALVLHEMNDTAQALESMEEARRRYHNIQDADSERDALKTLEAWRQGRTVQ